MTEPATSTSGKIQVSRPLVGLIALGLLGTYGVMWFVPVGGEQRAMWMGGFLRAGLIMSAFWLALPTKHRPAAWASVTPMTLVGLILGVVAVAARPRVFVPMLAVLAVIGFFLRPRRRSGDSRPDRSRWQR